MKALRKDGFTLIELIVVIAILGILAAVALPRFIDLQTQARVAKLNAGVGAVRAGAALFHAQCIANGSVTSGACPSSGAPMPAVQMEGLAVDGLSQYPDATLNGIIRAAGLSAGLSGTSAVDYVYTGGTSGTTLTIDVPSPTAGNCQFTYAPAFLSATAVTAPAVTITQASCN